MPDCSLHCTKLFLPYPQRWCHSYGALHLLYLIVAATLAQAFCQAKQQQKIKKNVRKVNFVQICKF